ncbi:hypothetical protein Tco_0046917 [Tanacetum coccineum]
MVLMVKPMVLMVEWNHGEHLIHRFIRRGNEPIPRDVKIASLKQRIQELEFPQLQQDSPTEEAETKSNETESKPIIWDIGDEEEEYPFVNKYPSFQEEPIMLVEEESRPLYDTDNEEEESMPVYNTDIEDVIEKEEEFVGKGGFNGEEDNIEDVVVVANDLCSSMIQTIVSVDFEEDINTKSHELMSFGKSIIIKHPMVRRSLNVDNDPLRPCEDNEEVLGPDVPYLSAIGALMYLTNAKPLRAFVFLLSHFSSGCFVTPPNFTAAEDWIWDGDFMA